MSRGDSCVDFADLAEDRESLFPESLVLENGLPSHYTFSRLFRPLDPSSLSSAFRRFLEALGADCAGIIAIDGMTLRRSFDREAAKSTFHVLTAFAAERSWSWARLRSGRPKTRSLPRSPFWK